MDSRRSGRRYQRLLSDDPEEDTGATEDTQENDAEAEDVATSEADEDEEDDTEAEQPEDDADTEPEMDGPIEFSDDSEVTLEDGSTVTLGDLKKGNLRQADYTRKTQDLAETKRQFEAKDQQLTGAAQNLVQQYEVLEQFLAQTAPQRPNAQMAQEDPFAFQQAQAAYYDHQERWQITQQQLQQARQHEEQRAEHEKQQKLQGRNE